MLIKIDDGTVRSTTSPLTFEKFENRWYALVMDTNGVPERVAVKHILEVQEESTASVLLETLKIFETPATDESHYDPPTHDTEKFNESYVSEAEARRYQQLNTPPDHLSTLDDNLSVDYKTTRDLLTSSPDESQKILQNEQQKDKE
jgi:hypothetical protein